ncbi:putative amidohydrolase [Pseudoclavibacter endophyticus]|nr:amidohydrolase [Pseudoclavibacter endophyticus]GGA63145.1 putative amidohydrolase [Pseudoclavibacter endophyticus]
MANQNGNEVIVRGGRVYTADENGPAWASGFRISNGVFTDVWVSPGDEPATVSAGADVLDLDGAVVVPGLFDAHVHPFFGGKKMLRPSLALQPVAGLDEILAAVETRAREAPDGAWITGGKWNATLTPQLTAAARERLDAVSFGHPVMLGDESGHNGWVNSAALAAAGYAVDGSESDAGFGRDADTGAPTGVLMERALDPVRQAANAASPDTVDDLKEYLLAAWGLFHTFGITAIQDAMTGLPELQAYAQLADEGRLPGWVSTCLSMEGIMAGPDFDPAALDDFARTVAAERIRTDFTKLALDGVPTTRTAGMLCPYLPDDEHGHDYHGIVYRTADELADVLRGYRAAGRSTKIHCAGDWAVRVAIDAFAMLRAEGSDLSYHIAHGQFVAPEDRKRMAEFDVVAEISPYIWYPGPIPYSIAAVLPDDVASRMQPNRDLLDLGVLVAGGSDWSVVPMPNAWEGIAGLVTRRDPNGAFEGSLWPEQAVTLEEALRIFTINGAKAARMDDVVGSIEVGKAANFAVLDRDPFAIDPIDIAATRAWRTYVAGECVHELRNPPIDGEK